MALMIKGLNSPMSGLPKTEFEPSPRRRDEQEHRSDLAENPCAEDVHLAQAEHCGAKWQRRQQRELHRSERNVPQQLNLAAQHPHQGLIENERHAGEAAANDEYRTSPEMGDAAEPQREYRADGDIAEAKQDGAAGADDHRSADERAGSRFESMDVADQQGAQSGFPDVADKIQQRYRRRRIADRGSGKRPCRKPPIEEAENRGGAGSQP